MGHELCASCVGRRIADTVGHLIDRVLPEVPVWQWVLSLPFALRSELERPRGSGRSCCPCYRSSAQSLRRSSRRSAPAHGAHLTGHLAGGENGGPLFGRLGSTAGRVSRNSISRL